MLKYYVQNPNCHKEELKAAPVYHASTCDDMKHATDIIDAKSISSLLGGITYGIKLY